MTFPTLLATEPRLKEVVWGSDRLQRAWGKRAPPEVPIGESWEVSTVDGWESGVRGSPRDLRALFEAAPAHFLGPGEGPRFPVLVKLLSTRHLLSLQVHPDDEQARALDGLPSGKRESWLVLEAEDDAFLYLGLAPGAGLDDLLAAVGEDRREAVRSLLRRVSVRPGDVFDVPPGTLHAMGPGLTVLEVQQPSDATYRVYDWGRPRRTEPRKAAGVVVPGGRPEPVASRPGRHAGDLELVDHAVFRLERWRVAERREVPVRGLLALTCLDGVGLAAVPGGEVLELRKGDSCVVPHAANMVVLEGDDLDLAAVRPPRRPGG